MADREKRRRQVPAWLTSLVLHLCLLLVLALIPFSNLPKGSIRLFWGSAGGEGTSDFELAGGPAAAVEIESTDANVLDAFQPDPSEILKVDIAKLVEPSPLAVETESPLPLGIAQGLSGRGSGMKADLLSRFGGTAETETAVERGLAWLSRQQRSDGSWSLLGPYSSGGANENTTAATAMALNAFLGAGHTHLDGQYANNVKRGLAYLTRRQDSDGFFSNREPSRQQMYAQALATIAVTEAYGMTDDEELRSSAGRALAFAEWSQSDLNGWRYDPRDDADLSVTGWFVMALETGKMAGLPVDEEKLQAVHHFLDKVSHAEDAQYAYQSIEPPSLTMTAEGLLCRIYLGWPKTHPALLRAIEMDLLPTRPRLDDEDISVYYWYYATQVMHHVGGPLWDTWNEAMKQVLPALQIKDGEEAGSWDPDKDIHAGSGGRLFTTCFNIYCLEVYYRHLSIYEIR